MRHRRILRGPKCSHGRLSKFTPHPVRIQRRTPARFAICSGMAKPFRLVDSIRPRRRASSWTSCAASKKKCLSWRWKLRGQTDRLRKTHGDFHPFNILFDDAGKLHLLDTSRGSKATRRRRGLSGDKLSVFGLEHRRIWEHGLGRLWDRFWQVYLAESEQIAAPNVLHAVAPYFVWRGLVLASPLWYPNLAAADRRRILAFVFRVLDAAQFDPLGATRRCSERKRLCGVADGLSCVGKSTLARAVHQN